MEITGKITKRLDGGYDVIVDGNPYGPITESTDGALYTWDEVTAYAEANPSMVDEEQEYVESDQEKIAKLSSYLSSTDWYAVRFAETGTAIPDDIKTARAEARTKISELRGD